MKLSNDRVYTLRLAGKDYTIRSADDPDHVRRMALYVDRKITEMSHSGFVNREDAAVISALMLSDELFTAQDDNTRLRRELWQLKSRLAELENKG
ncbi:MAG: cell division protein ZapA [Clostridia bacterium]|nr:cell division protein ZapA [Clostridia bacterium]